MQFFMRKMVVFLVCSVLLLPPSLIASSEIGLPLLQNIKPRDYAAGTQNWAVLQDTQGILYVGNNAGILEFDGVNWRVIQTANKSVVRSLSLAADGKIYVGAKGEIGYLEHQPVGPKVYRSLNELIPAHARNFQDVRQTFATPHGVFFISRDFVFLLNEDRIRVWATQSAFLKAFWVNDRLLLKEQHSALREWYNGQFRDVPQGAFFLNKQIYVIEPYKNNTLLIGTRNHGLFLATETSVTPFAFPLTDTLTAAELYSGLTLRNGHYALGTVHDGVFVVDQAGQLVDHITKASGLHDQNIRALFQDHQGGLWLALDHGLSRLNLSAALSVFNSQRGLEGNVLALHRYQDHLYAGTSLGLFKLADTPQNNPQFHRIASVRKQIWDFINFQDQLLAAGNQGVYQVNPEHLTLLRASTQASKVLALSTLNPHRLYVGLQDGLASMRFEAGTWIDEGKIAGIQGNLNSIVETAQGELWVGTLAHGVYQIKLPTDWTGGNTVQLAITHYTKQDGLPSLNRNTVYEFDDALYFATVRGIFRFEPQTNRFVLDPSFAAMFNGEQPWIRHPVKDGDGQVWMLIWDNIAGTRHAGVALPQEDGRYIWSTSNLQSLNDTPLDTLLLEDAPERVVWLGGAEGVFRFATGQFQAASIKRPLVRQVISGGSYVVYNGGSAATSLNLAANQHHLRFYFTNLNYNALEPIPMRIKLVGHDKDWSAWHQEHYRDYTNLPSGTYQFRLQTKDPYGKLIDSLPITVTIATPMYLQYWAITGYIAGVLLLLYGMMKWRTLTLLKEQQRLAKLVTKRTAHLEQALTQLELARTKAEAATEAKSQFLANVSHELRTPLNAVLGFAELAQRTGQPLRRQEYLVKIRTAGKILLSIINDLLDFSKIDAGKLDLEAIPFKLADCIEQAVSLFSEQIAQKQLLFTCEIDPLIPGQLVGDPLRLSQILLNLLSNALKFTDKGAISLHVALQEHDQTTVTLQFVLTDTGIGITPEQQQQLFQAFSQADNSVSRRYGGTGLGLVICQRLVQLMSGRIALESQIGQGTCVTFSAQFTLTNNLVNPSQDATGHEVPNQGSKRPKLLLVDGDPVNQHVVQLMIEQIGYQVFLANTDSDTMHLLNTNAISLIIIDIETVGTQYHQLLSNIRHLDVYRQVPVLAMSSHTTVSLGMQAGFLQFADIISKPVNVRNLKQQLQLHLP